jgi:protein SCO1/2
MQQILGDRMGKDVFFISISIDPEHDTPAALKASAAKYDAGPGWIFLTGKQSDIDMLSKKLGLWTDPTLTQDGHTPMLLIGNEATGQWTQTSALDNPKYVAQMIAMWFGGWKNRAPIKTTTDAVPMRKLDDGEKYFHSVCASCHTIGEGDKIGPDLSVALDRRERAWLTEYTYQPDVMRTKNDPIAKALADKYTHVRMPNLGLTLDEVKAVLHYVELRKSHVASATDSPAPAATRATATAGSTPSPASPLIEPAIAIQSALAGDTMVGVVAQAKTLRQAAGELGAAGAAMQSAAADLAEQTTIEDARRAFGAMSDALIGYLRTSNASTGGSARVAYCPMLRKSWLQKDGPVANPYYGKRMLNCGELTE